MKIKEVRILAFHGEERSGNKRNGEMYRSRVAEISWPDEDSGLDNRTMARLTTEACNDYDRLQLNMDATFTAVVTFSLTQGHTGYKFMNCFINHIL